MTMLRNVVSRTAILRQPVERRVLGCAAANALGAKVQLHQLQGVRHGGGASLIAAGIATAGLGGVGQGIGSVFAGMVVGIARNPAESQNLFSNAMIGFAMVEVWGFIIAGLAGLFFVSE